MNYAFNNSSIVSVNSGTIVLNVSGKTRTFADAKLVSAIDGKIVLDLPEASFKRGNYITLVTNKGMRRTFIFSTNTNKKAYYYVTTQYLGLAYNDFWFTPDNEFRNATPEEIQELNDQLASEGKHWNPDTMQIENLRWKPIEGTTYFYIVISGGLVRINSCIWMNNIADEKLENYYEIGNCFKTKEEAIVKLEQIKMILSKA